VFFDSGGFVSLGPRTEKIRETIAAAVENSQHDQNIKQIAVTNRTAIR
jgi:hypothetical protein